MLSTGTRQIVQRERSILEAAVAGGVPVVTAWGTVKWVLVWTVGLALLGLLTYGLVSLSPSPIVGGLLGGLLFVVAILCIYAIIALIGGYFHWGRVAREFSTGRRTRDPRSPCRCLGGHLKSGRQRGGQTRPPGRALGGQRFTARRRAEASRPGSWYASYAART